MILHLLLTMLTMLTTAASAAAPPTRPAEPAALKPRIVVLTDIAPNSVEPDDMESLIRLLVHADLFEIEGLIATTGWSNAGADERLDLVHDALAAYEKDLPNLRERSDPRPHDRPAATAAIAPVDGDESRQPQRIGDWPSADYLRSRSMHGSRKRGQRFAGKDNDSPGSDLIIRLADERDERPLWVLSWGGGNTLAQAIWRAREGRDAAQFKTFLGKLRHYAITDQDRGLNKDRAPYDVSSHFWMRREFATDLLFIWDECAWRYQNGTGKRKWDEYVQNHGHLGRLYPKYKYGVEGDTPSFLYVWPNGLNDPERPGNVGWGGYFAWSQGADAQTEAHTNHPKTAAHAICERYQERFYPATFNSFAARMDRAKDGAGNREPNVVIDGDHGTAFIRLTPTPGTSVTLDASASNDRDPRGDRLTFSWWTLPEAGTYASPVTITAADSARATIAVPADAAGKSFHVICEVTDDGTPPLTAYRRVVFSPTGRGADE